MNTTPVPGNGECPRSRVRPLCQALVATLLSIGLAACVGRGPARPGPQSPTQGSSRPSSLTGDGVADDTAAIQQAIDAAHAAGGGTVRLPPGVYKVKIQTRLVPRRALTIYPHIRLSGGVIKLADRQGNYASLLMGESRKADLSGFELSDITINQNAAGNPLVSEADLAITRGDSGRLILSATSGTGLKVNNVRFVDIGDSVNTLFLTGDEGQGVTSMRGTIVTNNVFEGVGRGVIQHDHSTFYWAGDGLELAHNRFTSERRSVIGAVTAIETHGSRQRVVENSVENFSVGMNITGVASFGSQDVTVADNSITGVAYGVYLWSFRFGVLQQGVGLQDVVIRDNTIAIDQRQWAGHRFRGLGPSAVAGIVAHPDSSLSIIRLTVSGNRIRFVDQKPGGTPDDAGIRWVRSTRSIVDQAISIRGNDIQGIPSPQRIVFRANSVNSTVAD